MVPPTNGTKWLADRNWGDRDTSRKSRREAQRSIAAMAPADAPSIRDAGCPTLRDAPSPTAGKAVGDGT
jgi:hypothetical protein